MDALFGEHTSDMLPDNMRFTHYRTGRMRAAYHEDDLLCTLRIDGGLALTPHLAQMLLAHPNFSESCVRISDEAAPFVREGKSVFARHVVWCGRRVAVGAEAPVIHDGTIIAVGRAVLSAGMMAGCLKGVAVRVRNSLKNSPPEQS